MKINARSWVITVSMLCIFLLVSSCIILHFFKQDLARFFTRVMSTGVTGVCVMSSSLPGVAFDGGEDSWNSRMTSTALYFVLKLQ